MSYPVRAEPAVADDLAELVETDRALGKVAVQLMLELRDNPWLGDELRERYNLRQVAGCRRLRFDLPGWEGKPRYRLVYRNEPSDGAPGLVRVWALGPRTELIAYARAAARLRRSEFEERRR